MKRWLADLPSTNFRIFVTMLCVFLTTVTVDLLLWFEKEVQEVVFGLWLGFLAAMAGVDYVQFAKKRDTHMEAPPSRPDIEVI